MSGADIPGCRPRFIWRNRAPRWPCWRPSIPVGGASGRNGGQINPGLKDNPDTIEARFGPEIGGRMIALSGGAADLVFALIDKHQIACDPVRSGWIRAAHSKASLRELHELATQWQRRGAPVEPLDSDQITRLIGTQAYLGGLIDRRGGNLHPLNYALGLASAAQAAGAELYGRSRVTGLSPTPNGHRLETAQGAVDANQVLICTNGYTGDVTPKLSRSVVPVRSVQVATAPLSDNVRASLLPDRQALSDTRRLLLYFRLDAQGRFIMGGRGADSDGSTRTQLQTLRQVSARLYPQLADADWQYAWGGYVAITGDHYPHLNTLAPGLIAGLGYNGRGVAMGTAMGKVMADWASGIPSADLDFPVTPLRPLPFAAAHRLGVRTAVARARFLDWLGV